MSKMQVVDLEFVKTGVKCPFCRKVCKTTSGLSKHLKTHGRAQ